MKTINILSSLLLLAAPAPAQAVTIEWGYSFHAYLHGYEEINFDYGIREYSGTFEADIDAGGLIHNPRNAVMTRITDQWSDTVASTRFEVAPECLNYGMPILFFYYENFDVSKADDWDGWLAWQFQLGEVVYEGFDGYFSLSHPDYWNGPVIDQYLRVRDVPESTPGIAALSGLLGAAALARRRFYLPAR